MASEGSSGAIFFAFPAWSLAHNDGYSILWLASVSAQTAKDGGWIGENHLLSPLDSRRLEETYF